MSRLIREIEAGKLQVTHLDSEYQIPPDYDDDLNDAPQTVEIGQTWTFRFIPAPPEDQ